MPSHADERQCGHLFRTASDYLVILDLDEVLALDPSTYDDAPASLLRFVESWDPDVGGVNLIRVDLSMQEQTFDDIVDAGGPSVELLAQDTWTALNPDPDLRKNCACRRWRSSLWKTLTLMHRPAQEPLPGVGRVPALGPPRYGRPPRTSPAFRFS
jgi:hypothetical protein